MSCFLQQIRVTLERLNSGTFHSLKETFEFRENKNEDDTEAGKMMPGSKETGVGQKIRMENLT